MIEITLAWIKVLQSLFCVLFAALYSFGGVSGKWKRRYIGPVVLTLAIVGFSFWVTKSFNYLLFLSVLPLSLSATIGYGINSKLMNFTKSKYLTRAIVGLAWGVSAIFIAIVHASWAMFSFHIFLCILTFVILGALNITPSARTEEHSLGLVASSPLVTMIG